ncbi:hypothetical protein GOP47_0003116 [Adiantum capillus-veneris]|uniref:Cupin type-1 domain-containing protein n=1 Tax=Adiantum capillus-veneris TaxID=13818 RepID=A0A9D4VD34_ADICA|nr:hypothetical protein GOP47_0003116 [Adiantum capillus-veneris]
MARSASHPPAGCEKSRTTKRDGVEGKREASTMQRSAGRPSGTLAKRKREGVAFMQRVGRQLVLQRFWSSCAAADNMALLMMMIILSLSCYVIMTACTPAYSAHALSTRTQQQLEDVNYPTIEQVVDIVEDATTTPLNQQKHHYMRDLEHRSGASGSDSLSCDSSHEDFGLAHKEVIARKQEEEEEEEEEEEGHRGHDREHEHRAADHESFLLGKPIKVMKTEAGELRVLPHGGINSELGRKGIGLGFLTLEPKALVLPHYIDADCLFLVHKGRGQLSWVDDDGLRNVDLDEGDIFKIESGTVFHVYNHDEGQRLSIFGIFDTSAVYTGGMFHSFFVAGGQKPTTVLSGFDESLLATVFKASTDELRDILSSQTQGPIIYAVHRNESKRLSGLGKSVTQILDKFIGLPSIIPKDSRDKPYNLFKKKPDFSNDYGLTAAIHGDDYKLLKDVNKGVFLVRLKAGAVLAPHWNPRATEIALVTKGEGEIQIVYPNGTAASTEQVREGNVFYVPQHFPMCQIASRSGPFEFVGFSTSARSNRPQFLAGSNSVLKALDSDVLASAFNMPSEHLRQFLEQQPESVILPGEPLSPSSPATTVLLRRLMSTSWKLEETHHP